MTSGSFPAAASDETSAGSWLPSTPTNFTLIPVAAVNLAAIAFVVMIRLASFSSLQTVMLFAVVDFDEFDLPDEHAVIPAIAVTHPAIAMALRSVTVSPPSGRSGALLVEHPSGALSDTGQGRTLRHLDSPCRRGPRCR
jgi:hypothetical protein